MHQLLSLFFAILIVFVLESSSIDIKKVTDPIQFGDSAHWDPDHQALYYVSITENAAHKYVPATGKHTSTKLGGRAGFIIPVKDTTDQFLVGVETEFFVIKWDGTDSTNEVIKKIGEIDKEDPAQVIFHGKADPRGRVLAGAMVDKIFQSYPQDGTMYLIDGDKVTKIDDYIRISAAMEWDLKQNVMYYTDVVDNVIKRYNYDVNTGKYDTSSMTPIFKYTDVTPTTFIEPTTIDNNGNLWVGVFNGSSILNINPKTGDLIQKISLDAIEVTSLVFGGPNNDVLFVTTANIYEDLTNITPYQGATLAISGLGVQGVPTTNYKI